MARITTLKQTYTHLQLGTVELQVVIEAAKYAKQLSLSRLFEAASDRTTYVLSNAQRSELIAALELWMCKTGENNVPGRLAHGRDVHQVLRAVEPLEQNGE